MGRLLFCSLFTAVVLFLSLSPVAYSDTFIDTFDDPVFTNNNWVTAEEEIQQVWTFPPINGTNLGYHASTTSISPPAAKIVHYGVPYYTSGLVIETLIRINFTPNAYSSESYAGVGFALSQENRCIVSLQLDFDGPTETNLQIHFDGEDIDEIPVSINFDTFYKLVVQVDSNNDISAYLYKLDGTLLGSVFANNILSIDSRDVGIFGTPEVTFDDFKLIGNPVGQTNALSRTQISQLYVSIFGRASEGEGNAYWQSWPDMATAANDMLETDAAKDYFGANLNTNQAFIEHIYLNTLNKTIADDFDGISYWVDMLDAGTTRGEAVAALVGAINDYAPGGLYYNPDDTATVAAYNQFINRVEVSNYMADNVYNTPDHWETSTSFSHGMIVTDDPSTVFTAMVIVNGFTDQSGLPGPCGAYVAPNVWKDFDCYNLAAIGKTTNDDPFTPSWRLIGGYWQWGRKGPDPSQWYDTNTPNFAHGPGPSAGEANEDEISVWDMTEASNGAWSDTYKTVNDPCPAGFRVPTKSQWEGVLDNNTPSTVGTWSTVWYDHTNYNAGLFLGSDLMLPSAGFRINENGDLSERGYGGSYWSSSQTADSSWLMYFGSDFAGTYDAYRRGGGSVRCVAE